MVNSRIVRLPVQASEDAADWHVRKRAAGRYRYALGNFLADAGDNHPTFQLGEKTALRFAGCGHTIITGHALAAPAEDGGKLEKGYWCNHRICPRCAAVLGNRMRERMLEGVERLMLAHRDIRVIELTLTARNCEWEALPRTVEHFQAAFRKLVGRSAIDRHLVACIRSIEITQGKDGLAHPHVHAVLFVAPSYFGKDCYIDKEDRILWLPRRSRATGEIIESRSYGAPYMPVHPEVIYGWVRRWQDAMALDYRPSVFVRAVRRGAPGEVERAIKHAVKYASKPLSGKDGSGRPTSVSGEALAWINQAIHGRRIIEIYGLLRELVREESVDETAIDETPEEETILPVHRAWKWMSGRDWKATSGYILKTEFMAATLTEFEIAVADLDGTLARPRINNRPPSPDTDATSPFPLPANLPSPHPGIDIYREAHRIATDLGIENATPQRGAFVTAYIAWFAPNNLVEGAR